MLAVGVDGMPSSPWPGLINSFRTVGHDCCMDEIRCLQYQMMTSCLSGRDDILTNLLFNLCPLADRLVVAVVMSSWL